MTSSELSVAEILIAAKDKGNSHFKKRQFLEASQAYEEGLERISEIRNSGRHVFTPEETELREKLHSNLYVKSFVPTTGLSEFFSH